MTTRAFWIDRLYDRAYAGPPPSRFRNYLFSRRGDIAEAVQEYGAVGWCQEVWKVAGVPVMYPGFVREAPEIVAASIGFAEDDEDRLALVVDVATQAFPGSWPAGVDPGWERGPSWGGPPFPLAETPLRRDRPSAATIVRVRGLLEPSPAPRLDDFDELWRAAEDAVERLVDQANSVLSPVLAALGEQR